MSTVGAATSGARGTEGLKAGQERKREDEGGGSNPHQRELAMRSVMLTASAITSPTAPMALMHTRLAATWAQEKTTRRPFTCCRPLASSTAWTNASVTPACMHEDEARMHACMHAQHKDEDEA
jgi:hypothetical protein